MVRTESEPNVGVAPEVVEPDPERVTTESAPLRARSAPFDPQVEGHGSDTVSVALTPEDQSEIVAAVHVAAPHTPAVGEQFTPQMADNFFARYGGWIQEAIDSIVGMLRDLGVEAAVVYELTPEILLTWNAGRSPYRRGHSDTAIELARLSFVSPDGITRRASIMLDFDLEELYVEDDSADEWLAFEGT